MKFIQMTVFKEKKSPLQPKLKRAFPTSTYGTQNNVATKTKD